MEVCVLFRFSTKTGKVDTTMIALGKGVLQLWGLQNTPKTKTTVIFERESGRLIYEAIGTKEGFPKIRKDTKDSFLADTCKDYGISLDFLHSITDPRFDTVDKETEA